MGSNSLPEFPSDLVPMENQVAGHDFKDGNNIVGLLKHESGYVLKPINKKLQGDCEINFYERLQKDTDNGFSTIKEFIPKYFGISNIKINGNDVRFLKLEDVTKGMKKPCIMDIKIGAQTWEPNATPSKRETEDNKYVASKKAFGFCIPGCQVYNISSNTFKKNGKAYCKTLNEETLPQVFREFLNHDSEVTVVLKEHFIQKLNKLYDWWSQQRIVHIYSSSILLLYDSEILADQKYNNRSEEKSTNNWIKVYMIDFAHVHQAESGNLDYNYINGLKNLIELLRSL